MSLRRKDLLAASTNLATHARRSTLSLVRLLLFRSGTLLRMARRRKCGVILMFHAIAKDSAEEFRSLLEHLAKTFSILPLNVFLAEAMRKGGPPAMTLTLTFDDGLQNHRTVVYPILTDLGLTATFYVCPGLIGRAKTTWTWEMICRIPWLKEIDRRDLYDRARINDPMDGGWALLEWMKTIPPDLRESIENEVRARTPDFTFTEAERANFELMSWKELKELDPRVITIGSHTMTHCNLPVLDQETLNRELEGSRAALEACLARPVRDFCYPDGKHNERVIQSVAQYYRSAVTVMCGSVTPGDSAYTLKRVGASLDLQWVSWLLATHTGRAHRC